MNRLGAVPMVGLVLGAIVAATPADGASLKVTCVDGNPQAVAKAPGEPSVQVSWTTCDDTVDGVCHFTGHELFERRVATGRR